VGVAGSCPESKVATGVTTLRQTDPGNLVATIAELRTLIQTYDSKHIVLGYPLHLDQTPSDQSRITLAFKRRLQKELRGITIELWDERYSTLAVSRILSLGRDENRTGIRKMREKVDEMAAVYILQGYLDCQNNSRKEPTMADLEKQDVSPHEEEHDDTDDIIVVTDENGNDVEMKILVTREAEDAAYVLAIEEQADGDGIAYHFKLTPDENAKPSDDDDEDVILEMIDDEHDEWPMVMELFKEDHKALGIED
jgi:putative Holliday junction resolvase